MALAERLPFHEGSIGALPLGGGAGRDLAELIRRPPWMADALCREHPDVDFFPHERRGANAPHVGEEARAICARCVVRSDCLAFALETGEEGVWGGTTKADRKAMRRGLGGGHEGVARA